MTDRQPFLHAWEEELLETMLGATGLLDKYVLVPRQELGWVEIETSGNAHELRYREVRWSMEGTVSRDEAIAIMAHHIRTKENTDEA